LRKPVHEGRADFCGSFPAFASDESQPLVAEPHAPDTFQRCKLIGPSESATRLRISCTSILLQQRRSDERCDTPIVSTAPCSAMMRCAALFSSAGDDRLLLVNLGADLFLRPAPEPLLAPPERRGWRVKWSSESPDYGGDGTPQIETTAGWLIPGRAAFLLQPAATQDLPDAKLSEKD